jgi:hypothetical protein
MKIVILCGGKGERFPGAYPKPMNRVWGKMLGEWVADSLRLNFNDIYWIVNPTLKEFSIDEEILRWWKGGTHSIYHLPFETREPCETLMIGLQYFIKENKMQKSDNILVIDNDNYYDNTLLEFVNFKDNGYDAGILIGSIPETTSNRYGFLSYKDGKIEGGREKERGWGENAISYGGYWFSSIDRLMIEINRYKESKTDLHEISLLNLLIFSYKNIGGVYTKNTYPLGTPEDCKLTYMHNSSKFGWKCKVVVDLDNTLVSYPTKYKDYSSCKEKKNITDWIRHISSEGAEVIIATARRMETNNNYIGKMIKNDGIQTLNHIESLHLGENEIHLGKPLGDIYLDDRAINPYTKDWKIFAGDWSEIKKTIPANFMGCTRNVSLSTETKKWVVKKGSNEELDGQTYFYRFLQKSDDIGLKKFFPKCYDITNDSITTTICIEDINGVPGSILLSHSLFGNREWTQIKQALQYLHTTDISMYEKNNISKDDIKYQWLTKIEERIQKYNIYKEVDINLRIWRKIYLQLKEYIETSNFTIGLIHGDFWLANILFTSNSMKLIDMRGKIKDTCTLYGDTMYDWAKLGTSFLGMDSIVYNLEKKDTYYLFEKIKNSIEPDKQKYLLPLTASLIYSSLWVYDIERAKKLIELLSDITTLYMD